MASNNIVEALEKRLEDLELKAERLFSGKIESEVLSTLEKDNAKLEYRLGILQQSIAEEEKMPRTTTKAQGGGPPPAKKAATAPPPPVASEILESLQLEQLSLQNTLKSWFKDAIAKAYPTLENAPVVVTATARSDFGEYQCNSAMPIAQLLSKQGTKTAPRAVAEALVKNVDSSLMKQGGLVSRLEIAGPGFVNIHLNPTDVVRRALELFMLGIEPPAPKKKLRVVIDYSSPNIAKEMHVGHLRSTIIGNCLARLFTWLGHDVTALNHIGDWGTQFGMIIAHLEDVLPEAMKKPELVPVASELLVLYKQSKHRFDVEEDFNKRAHECVVRLQNGDKQVYAVWQAVCDRSRTEFNKIYERLGVVGLAERGESFYQSLMTGLVETLKKDKRQFLKLEDGRWLWFPSNCDVPLTVVKSDGGYTYDTSDLAAVKQRLDVEKGDWLIYVVDAGQSLHFQTIFAAARDAAWYDPAKKRIDHVAFGLVLGEDKKKFKTREGDTVKLVDLLDEGIRRSEATLREKGRDADLTAEEFAKAKAALAYGCIRYADLSHNRISDYVFSFDKMLDDKGNTAVYLMYVYTRIRSIARNAGVSRDQLREHAGRFALEHEREIKLARKVVQFWDVLPNVVNDLMLHYLCEYLFDLASVFNEFYDVCYCVEKNKEGVVQKVHKNRLLLCEVTADVIATAFNILGIECLEKIHSATRIMVAQYAQSSPVLEVLSRHEARPALAVGSVALFCLIATFACVSSTHSLVLMAYAYICVFDLFVVITALITLWVQQKQPTIVYSYGYERFEVLAVFTSTVLTQLGAVFILKETTERFLETEDLHAHGFVPGVLCALLSHLLVIYTLRNTALQHVVTASSSSWLQEHVADLSHTLCRFVPGLSTLLLPRVNPFTLLSVAGALACLVSHFLVQYEECYICDTIAALCLAVMMFGTMHPMSVYTGRILLQTTPSHMVGQLDKCLRESQTLDGVLELTNEHFWQLSFGQLAGSVHVRVRRDADEQLVLAHVTDKMSQAVSQLTVQIVKDADFSSLSGGAEVYHHQAHGHSHDHGSSHSGDNHGHSHDHSTTAHGHSHDGGAHGHSHDGGGGSGHGHSHDSSWTAPKTWDAPAHGHSH